MDTIINLFTKKKWIFLIIFILLFGYFVGYLVTFVLLFGYPVGYFVLDSNKSNNNIPTPIDGVNHGTGVYIINLDRSRKRYEYIKNYANGLGLKLERIEAIDGSTLSTEEINEKVDLESYKIFLGHYPKRGTIGCSLSHIKALETFLNSNLEFAVIFEDDVSFDPIRVKVIIEDLEKNNKLWDIASLEISHHGFPLTLKNLTTDHRLVVYLTEIARAGAYMINRVAAKKLLDKALPIKMTIDHYFTRAWEFNIKFTGVENPRLIDQTFGDSYIDKTQKLPGEKISVINSFKRSVFKLQSYAIRFLYNLKLYLAERLQKNHLS